MCGGNCAVAGELLWLWPQPVPGAGAVTMATAWLDPDLQCTLCSRLEPEPEAEPEAELLHEVSGEGVGAQACSTVADFSTTLVEWGDKTEHNYFIPYHIQNLNYWEVVLKIKAILVLGKYSNLLLRTGKNEVESESEFGSAT